MTAFFTIANRLSSLGFIVAITDDNDRVAYEAKSEFVFSKPTWRLYQNERLVAIARWRFSDRPIRRDTWDIEGDLGAFTIGPKSFSLKRKMVVEGGAYDGASLTGSAFDLRHSIKTVNGVELAKVTSKMLSLRKTRKVELISQSKTDVLFSVVCVLALHITRALELNRSGD